MCNPHRTVLLGLVLLSLTAVCTGNCTFHFDEDGLNPEIEMQIRLRFQVSENCDSSMFLNINCTFEHSLKPYLDDILNNSISEDGRSICSNDTFRLFITKPPGVTSIADLPESLLVTNISIKHLYLDALGLSGIPRGFFDPQESLEVIRLRKNSIDWISGTAFDKLVNLKELDLSHNKLYSFNSAESGSLQNLEILNISFNRFADIPQSTFHSMDNLRELYLSGNQLYYVNALLLKT
nr:unnamed protein product [Callosobruchus chinensis]